MHQIINMHTHTVLIYSLRASYFVLPGFNLATRDLYAGVAQKLDRLKLMQVIDGEKSIESIMQGSYVQFEFNSGAKSQ